MSKLWAWLGASVGIAVPIVGGLLWLFQLKADMAMNAAKISELQQQVATKADSDDINRLDQDIRELRKALEDAELIDRKH